MNKNHTGVFIKTMVAASAAIAVCAAIFTQGVRAADDVTHPCPEGDGWVKYTVPTAPPGGINNGIGFDAKMQGIADQICVRGESGNPTNSYIRSFDVGGVSYYIVSYEEEGEIKEGVCLRTKSYVVPEISLTKISAEWGGAPRSVCSQITEVSVHFSAPQPTPTPEVTPAPIADPVATPAPSTPSKESKFTASMGCNSNDVVGVIELKDNGQPAKYVNVKFKYNGVEKMSQTNDEGRTSMAFPYAKDDSIYVYPEQDYKEQSMHVAKPTNCPVTQVLGATTAPKTYAATGAMEDAVMNMVGYLGAVLTAGGSAIYATKKRA